MFQALSGTCSDNIHRHLDYFICVCYHQNLTLHRLGSANSPFLMMINQMTILTWKGKNKLVPKQSSQEEKIFEEINSNQVKPKQSWSCLSSPFWHHKKRVVRENRVNQGVYNHRYLGNGGKKR